jgi:hypothetical protein
MRLRRKLTSPSRCFAAVTSLEAALLCASGPPGSPETRQVLQRWVLDALDYVSHRLSMTKSRGHPVEKSASPEVLDAC